MSIFNFGKPSLEEVMRERAEAEERAKIAKDIRAENIAYIVDNLNQLHNSSNMPYNTTVEDLSIRAVAYLINVCELNSYEDFVTEGGWRHVPSRYWPLARLSTLAPPRRREV